MSQATALIYKYAHNVMSINDHRDNASINITCSLEILYVYLKSLLALIFLKVKKSKFRYSDLFE